MFELRPDEFFGFPLFLIVYKMIVVEHYALVMVA